MGKVDILLPIYNSYKETRGCIESIINYTDNKAYNLYLLDDKSPDPRIQELTAFYSENRSNIYVFRNEKNLGFPGNVNNGFMISKNDVIVINSDTLVTESWLEKMYHAAYSDETIAAINPMSNYGIISGLPTSNNAINDLFSFEELTNAFQKSKVGALVETPLLIGFCMYMKRSALERVGLFDAATFKRGYGEETDWCMRARENGLKLKIATAAYVHHIGGISFGEEKEELRRTSKKILLKRYPSIDQELEQFVRGNHLKEIRKCMIKNLDYLHKKPKMMLKVKMFKHYFTNML